MDTHISRFATLTGQKIPDWTDYISFVITEFNWMTDYHIVPDKPWVVQFLLNCANMRLLPCDAAYALTIELKLPIVNEYLSFN